jgi:hypothetical protein
MKLLTVKSDTERKVFALFNCVFTFSALSDSGKTMPKKTGKRESTQRLMHSSTTTSSTTFPSTTSHNIIDDPPQHSNQLVADYIKRPATL